jgi:hypothetical protein
MKKIKTYNQLNCHFRKDYFFFMLLFSLTIVTEINSQKKWAFETKTGINFTTQKLGDANLKTGFGFEGAFTYKFMPHVAAYAGWSWNKFSATQSFAGNNIDFEETGYFFGVQFVHPIANSTLHYMIKGGGTYNHIETENSEGKIINDSGHGLGWQLGAGVNIPFGKRWLFIPELRYRSLSRDISIGEVTTPVNLNYISTAIGVSYTF